MPEAAKQFIIAYKAKYANTLTPINSQFAYDVETNRFENVSVQNEWEHCQRVQA